LAARVAATYRGARGLGVFGVAVEAAEVFVGGVVFVAGGLDGGEEEALGLVDGHDLQVVVAGGDVREGVELVEALAEGGEVDVASAHGGTAPTPGRSRRDQARVRPRQGGRHHRRHPARRYGALFRPGGRQPSLNGRVVEPQGARLAFGDAIDVAGVKLRFGRRAAY
jgi:hypothetical protein